MLKCLGLGWTVTLALLAGGCGGQGSGGDGLPSTTEPTTGPTTTGSLATGGPAQCEGSGDGWGGMGDSGGGMSTGGGPIGMKDDMPLVASIPDIQQGVIDRDTLVSVTGVVVITPAADAETGTGLELFVQDPAGGQWSGLRLRGLDPAQLPAVGDQIDVEGTVLSRNGFFVVDVSSGADGSITALGPGVTPPLTVVSIAELSLDNMDARAYEGVPVRVEQVAVTDDDPCDGEFIIEATARVDDRFMPGALQAPPPGTVLTAVEGVLVYAEDSLELAPRGADAVE